jgi:hypothetical protein
MVKEKNSCFYERNSGYRRFRSKTLATVIALTGRKCFRQWVTCKHQQQSPRKNVRPQQQFKEVTETTRQQLVQYSYLSHPQLYFGHYRVPLASYGLPRRSSVSQFRALASFFPWAGPCTLSSLSLFISLSSLGLVSAHTGCAHSRAAAATAMKATRLELDANRTGAAPTELVERPFFFEFCLPVCYTIF